MPKLISSLPRRRDTIAASIRTKPPTRDSLALDYQWTNEQIKLLTDIRFRLLVLVPPLVAVGVTLLSNPTFGGGASPPGMVGVGLLGLSITFGVVLYDLRNSQLYDALINRAMLVERKMRMDTLIKDIANSEWGGPHAMRISGFGRLFWFFPISHGTALSLIYGVLLAAWVYPISKGLLVFVGIVLKANNWETFQGGPLIENSGSMTTLCALLLAALAALLLNAALRLLDQSGLAPQLIYEDSNRPVKKQTFDERSRQFLRKEFRGLWAWIFIKSRLIQAGR